MKRARCGATLALIAAVGVGLAALTLDTAPTVPRRAPPTAAEVAAAHAAVDRLRVLAHLPPPVASVSFAAADIASVASLAGDALHLDRVAARLTGGRVEAVASRRLPFGLWLNLGIATDDAASLGFPRVRARIGAILLPAWATRLGIDAARALAGWRGGRLPPLDRLVQRFTIRPGRVDVLVMTPLNRTGLLREIMAIRAAPVDAARVAALYCGLLDAHAAVPDADFAAALRFVFAGPAPSGAPDVAADNRAAFIALAMAVVGPRAGDLAGDASARVAARCPHPPIELRLGGRTDLPKHWALSAALGATVGGDITRAMGEWKELSDSLPGGSGFSLVDLSADRAGLRIGRAAGGPERAAAMRVALAVATAADLLPIDATLLAENLPNSAFVARYGDIDRRNYASAIAGIDRLLDDAPLLRATR